MARPVQKLGVNLTVEYTPIPADRVFAWRAGILLLLELLRERRSEIANGHIGLLGMMVPLSAWLMDRNEVEILQTLWIVVVSAGLTVFALYGLDHYLELSMRDIEATERESMQREADGKKS